MPELHTLVSGWTAKGQRLVVVEDYDAGLPYEGRFKVTLDGQQLKVTKASRLRDGGTTFITTEAGAIYVPQQLWPKNPPQVPTFNGKPIK